MRTRRGLGRGRAGSRRGCCEGDVSGGKRSGGGGGGVRVAGVAQDAEEGRHAGRVVVSYAVVGFWGGADGRLAGGVHGFGGRHGWCLRLSVGAIGEGGEGGVEEERERESRMGLVGGEVGAWA